MYNIIRIRSQSDYIYVQYFEHESVKDLKQLLLIKYDICDGEKLEIYQNLNILNNDQKLKDLDRKDNLYVKCFIKKKSITPIKNEEKIQKPSEIDYLSKFHDMGFSDSDEAIEKLFYTKGKNFVDTIAILLKMKKSKLKK